MLVRTGQWFRPDNNLLLLSVCLTLVLVVGGPSLFSIEMMSLVAPVLIGISFVLFSVQRTLIVLLLLNIVLPVKVLMQLRLVGGLQFQEILILVALLFASIELIYRRSLSVRRTEVDFPVLIFGIVVLCSAAVGMLNGNSLSVLFRDLRFPLYYLVFFLVTNFVDSRAASRLFVALLIFSGLVVSVEYILEFLGAIDLSAGTRFVRVARLQGLILPVALLLIVNQFIYDPKQFGRPLLFSLFLPIGLAFVLTVGRGMWVAFAVGLLSVAWFHRGLSGERRGTWRTAIVILSVVGVLATTVAAFQSFTGAAVSAHALERSRTFVDIERDVHVLGRLFSYSNVAEAILQHPILGGGQGATLTFPIFNATEERFQVWTVWTVDNLYLMLLWKMGLIGLLAASWLGWRMLRSCLRTLRGTTDPTVRAFSGGALAVLIAMFTLGLSDGSMIHGRFALVFGVLFGLIAVTAEETGMSEPVKA